MLKIFITIIVCIVMVSIVWRILSRFCIIPCPAWLGWLVELDNPLSTINRSKTIMQHINLKPGMKILDIGCGPGRLTIPIAQAVDNKGSVVAMDIQKDMLKRVAAKAQKKGLSNITYLHAGIGEHTLPAASFDRILLVTVLGEIPQQQEALLEIYNALKFDGILSITEIIFDPHYQRQTVVRQLARDVRLEECGYFSDWFAYTLNFRKP